MALFIGRSIYAAMIAHLQSVYPLEGCGLLAGADGRVQQHYPVNNRLDSPAAYEMEPAQLIAAFTAFEAEGLTLQAVYHSHPNGPAVPSATDIAQANYPEAAQIIISFEEPARPQTAAFQIVDGRVSPINLTVV
jgi:proteasome lid subunit RPN8/RPN11